MRRGLHNPPVEGMEVVRLRTHICTTCAKLVHLDGPSPARRWPGYGAHDVSVLCWISKYLVLDETFQVVTKYLSVGVLMKTAYVWASLQVGPGMMR